MRKAIERTSELSGAKLIVVPIPLPLPAGGEVIERVVSRIGDRTRLLVVDHVASPTGVIFPVAGIVAATKDRGVPVLVDAAHAPGMLPVDVEALGADFWTGNFHKWCCAPKGTAALVIAPSHREMLHPLVTSHGLGEGLRSEFDWQGTNDPTAWLATPAALDFMDALGWDRVRAHNHALVTLGRDIVAASVKASTDDVPDAAIGSMAIVPLPAGSFRSEQDAEGSSRTLLAEHHVEVPAVWWNGRSFLRLSAQVYNAPADYERLAEALPALVGSRS